jgi:PhzF family phenazine biosynthesis protein
MKIKIYQVDAFTDKVFSGNPAAVCPLESWPDDKLLQHIAAENNLAETAFFVPQGDGFKLRWLTPKAEVNLCGHATIATAYILFNLLHYTGEKIVFSSKSGTLEVRRDKDWYYMNFPADALHPLPVNDEHRGCFSKAPLEVYRGKSDLMFVYGDVNDVKEIEPDLSKIAQLPFRGVIVTARGNDVDFVSRFFAPAVGIPEDPVTGSAHTSLTPYWSGKLGKIELTARQISERGGYLRCKMMGDRVEIGGQAAFYLSGEITV